MRLHYSEDVIERYSMGDLQEPEAAHLEEHLLQCDKCLEALRRMDVLIEALGSAAFTEP